ncbi:MAG: DUF177 domain-containing protein [Desulfobulbaceae bacterium]|nr:DUF177 domain-containing protein [Desulfobulbaceae bacterium]
MNQTLSFSEIPEQGIHLEINDLSWFPEEQVQRSGPVSATLYLARKGENKIVVRGKLKADVILACDRCLTEFAYAVDSPIDLILEVNDPEHHWRVQDLEGGRADIETVLLDSPEINIGEILREQVLLALPEKKLCRQSCAGLCSRCGADLNREKCSCGGELKNSPFAVLAQIKKNK